MNKIDPRFPDRPQHEDFWIISQALRDHDAAADAGKFKDLFKDIVDMNSLNYAAFQRSLRIGAGSGGAALFMDGFMAGYAFAKAKLKEDKKHEDHE